MTAAAEIRRRGSCPGALRPMPSGDGLLVRIKPSCGILALDTVEAVALLARAHGNGMIELSSRGNLQLRGARSETLAPLTEALDALGLLDASPEAEAVRNVIATPLAGLDPRACDTRPIVKELERRLAADPTLAGLPGKFGFLIDGGGVLPLTGVEADIAFVWGETTFAVGLARDIDYAWIGSCAAADVTAVAVALAQNFVARAAGIRRMRMLSDSVRRSISAPPALRPPPPEPWPQGRVSLAGPASGAATAIGMIAGLSDGGEAGGLSAGYRPIAVGIGLPYGAATSTTLTALMKLAHEHGACEIRLTPWRALLIPIADLPAAESLLTATAALGLITKPTDPRRSIAACPGAPACTSATTPVRADADRLSTAGAGILGEGVTVHVSGCAKGCARRPPASLTFVAEDGRYGLVVNGTASERAQGRFTAEAAADRLARLAQAMTKAGDRAPGATTPDDNIAAIVAALKEI